MTKKFFNFHTVNLASFKVSINPILDESNANREKKKIVKWKVFFLLKRQKIHHWTFFTRKISCVWTQCGKMKDLLSQKKEKFRQINSLVISLEKRLFSRNFCQRFPLFPHCGKPKSLQRTLLTIKSFQLRLLRGFSVQFHGKTFKSMYCIVPTQSDREV